MLDPYAALFGLQPRGEGCAPGGSLRIMKNETAFEMATSGIRFGAGVTREVGLDLADLGIRRVLVLTDPKLTGLLPVQTVLHSLDDSGISHILYDRVRVEPSDQSFLDAIAFGR